MREVIVVCYGNVCRSPMGEALLQRALADRLGPNHGVLVTSAGIGAHDGLPPSRGSVHSMNARGIDIRPLRSCQLTPEMIRRAELLLCMEEYQVERILKWAPDAAGKVRLWGGEEVPDPIGQGQFSYDAVAYQLETLLPKVVDDVVASLGLAPNGA